MILAFVAALLLPAVAGGRVLATGDALCYYWPIRVLLADLWLAGVPPFWNPYGFGGLPLWSAIQAGPLFPGNFPFLVAPPGLAMNLTVALAYVVGGAGMGAFLRATGLPAAAALLGALVFTGSGFLLAHMEHLTSVQTGTMLPWLLWAIARHRDTGDGRFAIALAALIGVQVAAGYPQLVWESALVAGPYALWRARGLDGATRPRHLLALVAGTGLGLALGLVLILPLAAFLGENQRVRLSFDELTQVRYSLLHFGTMLFPFMFGAPPSGFYAVPYWGVGPYFADVFGYAGLGPLMLAVVALVSRRTRGEAGFWAAIGLAAAALMLGTRPLWEVLHRIPVLNAMRSPSRHVFELDVAIAVLAALGLAALLATDAARARRLALIGAGSVLASIAGGLALVGVLGPAYARRAQPYMPPDVELAAALQLTQPAFWVPAVTAVVTAAALAALVRRPTAWRQGLLVAAIAADLLQVGQFVGFRTHAVPDLAAGGRWLAEPDARVYAVGDSPYPFRDAEAVAAGHRPYHNLFLGERHVGGAEGFVPDRTLRLLGGMNTYGWIADDRLFAAGHHALDLLGTREVRIPLASLGRAQWPMRLPAPRWERGPDAAGLAVFRNPRARPRAWRVAATTVLPAAQVDARITGDAAFDPAALALLDAAPAAAAGSRSGLAPGPARLVAPDANHLRVTTDGAGPGFVVLSEAHDAGWRAAVDGEPAPIVRVDGLLMGVFVPAGPHEIALAYEPVGFRGGLAGSLAAAFALAGWWLVLRRRRRSS